MSAAEVRRAVADWFTPPAIAGLVRMYPAQPTFADGREWDFGPDARWAAVGFLELPHREETRIALGGAYGGMKAVAWTVALVLLYRYVIPDPVPVDSDLSEWVIPLDGLLDAVVERIREDRTFGCGTDGPIWQVGEGDGTNTPDVVIDRDTPVEDAGLIHAWLAVQFTAIEIDAT